MQKSYTSPKLTIFQDRAQLATIGALADGAHRIFGAYFDKLIDDIQEHTENTILNDLELERIAPDLYRFSEDLNNWTNPRPINAPTIRLLLAIFTEGSPEAVEMYTNDFITQLDNGIVITRHDIGLVFMSADVCQTTEKI